MTSKKSIYTPLDDYERELKKLIDSDVLVPVANLEEEKKKHEQIARNTIEHLKNKTVNIRIAEPVLSALKQKAAASGIPYQTIISSLLYQYVSGKITLEV